MLGTGCELGARPTCQALGELLLPLSAVFRPAADVLVFAVVGVLDTWF